MCVCVWCLVVQRTSVWPLKAGMPLVNSMKMHPVDLTTAHDPTHTPEVHVSSSPSPSLCVCRLSAD